MTSVAFHAKVEERYQANALIQPLKTRDSELNRSPGRVNVTSETGSRSEPAKEFHYGGVISPPFLDSEIAVSWVASSESLRFRGEVRFGVDIGCVERNVAQPCPDCVEIDTSTKQVRCGRMPNCMRTYTFGFQRRDPYCRAFSMTRYERVDSEPCYGIAISIEKQGIGGIPSSDERPEFSHCLFPERAEPNLPAFSADFHRASTCCVPSQILNQNSRGLRGARARVVEE